MKQLPTLPLLAALLLSAATISAQTTFHLGLRGGLNRALTTVDPASNSTGNYPYSYSADKSALYAWQAGVVGEIRSGNFAFQPALVFSQKGNEFHTSTYASGFIGYSAQGATGTNRTNWLELPLNFVYTLHGDHGLQVVAGPYEEIADQLHVSVGTSKSNLFKARACLRNLLKQTHHHAYAHYVR